ncbi:hypothetical protein JB92DRAFT_2711599, partial [Gautieria morchelliformis]
ILVYPPATLGAINVTNADMHRLAPGQWLNDTVIELGLSLLHHDLQHRDRTLAANTEFFSTFFFSVLGVQSSGYRGVSSWTSGYDIFARDFIFIPIHASSHWFLAVVCFPGHLLACSKPNNRQNLKLV